MEAKAKEMFEKLGCSIFYDGELFAHESTKNVIRYSTDYGDEIEFNKNTKAFRKYNAFRGSPVPITVDELKAINKQVEELGW